jgi:hypothetical protein
MARIVCNNKRELKDVILNNIKKDVYRFSVVMKTPFRNKQQAICFTEDILLWYVHKPIANFTIIFEQDGKEMRYFLTPAAYSSLFKYI